MPTLPVFVMIIRRVFDVRKRSEGFGATADASGRILKKPELLPKEDPEYPKVIAGPIDVSGPMPANTSCVEVPKRWNGPVGDAVLIPIQPFSSDMTESPSVPTLSVHLVMRPAVPVPAVLLIGTFLPVLILGGVVV